MTQYVSECLDGMYTERTKAGLSRKQVSQLSGIHMGCIAHYENGTRNIGRKNFNRLARVFGWEVWQ